MSLKTLISNHYETYLEFLRTLIFRPSEFTKPEDVKKAIEYCKSIFEKNLSEFKVYFDDENNLIAIPQKIESSEDIVYLSAHIDTVGADPDEWDAPFHPWEFFEDEHELVARGVNDCKAGVAFQLFLSQLLKDGHIELKNAIFTITFKEEGVGKKTSVEMAKVLGHQLPLSEKNTYLLVLENNVRVAEAPVLCVYASERSNYVVEVEGGISQLKSILDRLEHWNPVSIRPQEKIQDLNFEVVEQAGGHVCSVNREENKLTQVILNSNANAVIMAGEVENFAVVPTKISHSKAEKPVKHALVIGNRSFDTREEVLDQLKGVDYKILKDFSISQGFNSEEKFKMDRISEIVHSCEKNSDIKIELTYNVGASDGSIIFGSMDPRFKKNFFPLVMGPGSRSQREKSPKRLTHGKNETFDKRAGKMAVGFISEVLEGMGFVGR